MAETRKFPYVPVRLDNGLVFFCTKEEYRKLGQSMPQVVRAQMFNPKELEDEHDNA